MINFHLLVLMIHLQTLPGAIIGDLLTNYISIGTFDIKLGLILLIISIFLLIKPDYKGTLKINKPRHAVYRIITDSKGERYSYSFNLWTGIILSLFIGFISSLLGIVGGIIHVPALTALLGFPLHIDTAHSHLILAVIAMAGTMVHIYQGNFKSEWITTLSIG